MLCHFYFYFLSCCPYGQGHSEGLYDQIITISTISQLDEITIPGVKKKKKRGSGGGGGTY